MARKEIQTSKDRTDLFYVESITLLDEELDNGILKPNKINVATLAIFALLELILFVSTYFVDFTVPQLVFLSVFGLFTARQIALDFAYHIFLDIYTLPMCIAAVLAPSMLFGYSSILGSLAYGFGLMIPLLCYTLICSFIKKQPAGLGFGDIKFSFAMGALLASGLSIWLNMLLFSIISLIITCFYEDKKNVPMGPGLLLAFWICLLFNSRLFEFFINIVG